MADRHAVVPATAEHVGMLAANLRAQDLAEIAGTGSTVKRSLWRGYRNSILVETAFVDGEVAAMWGLCCGYVPGLSLLSDVGRPWLLTTAAVERVPVTTVREARRAVERMLMVKPVLENYVLASYDQAVRMLRMIGFTIDPPQPVGRDGEPYSRFHMRRPCHG